MARTPARVCAICGASLAGRSPKALTCSPAHQKAYARQRQREAQRELRRAETGMPATTVDAIQAIVRGRQDDVIRNAFVEELRPVLREAIDESVVKAISGMVSLAPAAVLALQSDLTSEDPHIRHRAAALIVKYTMGNPLVTPAREGSGDPLVVINNLPRPDAAPGQVEPPIEATAEEDDDARRCDTCRMPKPKFMFPADGPRCADCLDERKRMALDAIESKYGSHPDTDRPAVLDPGPAHPGQDRPAVHPGTPADPVPARPEVRTADGVLAPGQQSPSGHAAPAGLDVPGSPGFQARQEQRATAFPGPRDPRRFSLGSA